jgi:hypothetical protein
MFKGSAGLFLPKDAELLKKEISEKNNSNINEKLMSKVINWQNEKLQLLIKKESQINSIKNEQFLLKKLAIEENEATELFERKLFKNIKDNFNDFEIQKLRKFDEILQRIPIFLLKNPEKYFSDGK